MAKIMVTGSHGYVGSVLVSALLDAGHQVVGYDKQFFGDHIGHRKNLHTVVADIRDTDSFAHALLGCDTVLHLACISNDPSFELDEELSRTINYECFEPLVLAAKLMGVKRFIYCSTSSVYGISESPDVTEDHPFVPITLYNRYKGMCEPLLFKHQSDDFTCAVLRPSTVCGYSPRMRLDLSVNILTNQAVNKGAITVFGGAQMRPNLHIKDMVRAYLAMIDAPAKDIQGQAFNVGRQNMSIMDIAKLVQKVVGARYSKVVPIDVQPMADQRSYQVNSDKIKRVLGFKPRWSIEDAINDVCGAFDGGLLPNPDDDRYYNVKTMKETYQRGVMSEIDLHRMASR